MTGVMRRVTIESEVIRQLHGGVDIQMLHESNKWIPSREELLTKPWLRPLWPYLRDDRLWHLNKHSVAKAVAIGLFFGLLLPVAQILFAVVGAVALRGHVAICAACTLITNPFTFPPIYWLAYQIGSGILGQGLDHATADAVAQQRQALAEQHGWLEGLMMTLQSAGAPLALGLAILAVAGAILGYLLVQLLWRPHHGPANHG